MRFRTTHPNSSSLFEFLRCFAFACSPASALEWRIEAEHVAEGIDYLLAIIFADFYFDGMGDRDVVAVLSLTSDNSQLDCINITDVPEFAINFWRAGKCIELIKRDPMGNRITNSVFDPALQHHEGFKRGVM